MNQSRQTDGTSTTSSKSSVSHEPWARPTLIDTFRRLLFNGFP
jgi:hypothetical protein